LCVSFVSFIELQIPNYRFQIAACKFQICDSNTGSKNNYIKLPDKKQENYETLLSSMNREKTREVGTQGDSFGIVSTLIIAVIAVKFSKFGLKRQILGALWALDLAGEGV
jgi:hypothetical protein